MMSKFKLPATFPNKRILSVDIGGSLAKSVFYVPKDDPIRSKDIDSF